MNEQITVQTNINASAAKVWDALNDPEAMKIWGAASDDWHTVSAINDVRVGGAMSYRMEAKDGRAGFDLSATYSEVLPNELLTYTMNDGRKVRVDLKESDGITSITETFEPENENPIEMQRVGWQAVLDNLKRYVESL